jgi:hypothetical protein
VRSGGAKKLHRFLPSLTATASGVCG